MNEEQQNTEPLDQLTMSENEVRPARQTNMYIYYIYIVGAALLIVIACAASGYVLFKESTNPPAETNITSTATTNEREVSTIAGGEPSDVITTSPSSKNELTEIVDYVGVGTTSDGIYLYQATTSANIGLLMSEFGWKHRPPNEHIRNADDPNHLIYYNEEWGFQFEYPKNWEIWENSFRSGSSRFNIVLMPLHEPRIIRGILLNVTFDTWAQGVLAGVKRNEREVSTSTIAGYSTFSFDSTDMGLPTEANYIQLNKERWIFVSVTHGLGYEEVFGDFKDSLQFFPEEHTDADRL